MTGRVVVVGVDPGSRNTGIVARGGTGLVVAAELIYRPSTGAIADKGYVLEVCDAVDTVTATLRTLGYHVTVAAETVTAPTPHLGLSNPGGVIGAAIILGAIIGRHPDLICVPPGGHGSKPLAAYPAVLVGATERKGTGKRRHLRSAYDVAAAAWVEAVAGGGRRSQPGR